LVTIATDCTQSHPAQFPLTVSARHYSRQEAISKPSLLVCQNRRTDIKLCCNCWLCSCCLQSGTQISTLRCGFMYNLVQNARCMAVSLSVFVEWRTE